MNETIAKLRRDVGASPFDVTTIKDDEELAALTRDPLLETREHTHGRYHDVALISQAIKSFLRAHKNWESRSDIERESMDMIAMKFARIIAGRPMQKQHWEDVIGYAKLVEEQCV